MHCITVDLQSHISTLSAMTRDSRMAGHRIRQLLDYSLWFELKKHIAPECDYFQTNLHELSVEVDLDSERVVKGSGICTSQPLQAHQLADPIAWSNHANSQVKGVKHGDLAQVIDQRTKKRLHL